MKNNYKKLSSYLKKKYGTRVHKISVAAGFSCPNRDGTISDCGCIYCNNEAFSFQSRQKTSLSLNSQIESGIKAAKNRFKANKFIVYFQAYSNTYGSLEKLKETYDVIKDYDDVIGLSIGTRPDCINKEILDLINSYTNDYEVWLEYGLQSIHNNTLRNINRGHTYEDFLAAVNLTRNYKINICTHVILGLLEETREMMLATAKQLAKLKIDGIKIHPLHIVRESSLEKTYKQKRFPLFSYSQYLELTAAFITYLWPETIIHRVSAYCPPEYLIAPDWVTERHNIENDLDTYLEEKIYFQGMRYKE